MTLQTSRSGLLAADTTRLLSSHLKPARRGATSADWLPRQHRRRWAAKPWGLRIEHFAERSRGASWASAHRARIYMRRTLGWPQKVHNLSRMQTHCGYILTRQRATQRTAFYVTPLSPRQWPPPTTSACTARKVISASKSASFVRPKRPSLYNGH